MVNKIILGTVQFGLDYGINNANGKPKQKEVLEILEQAYQNGVEFLDTADAYGTAIDHIGAYHRMSPNRFKIITKFSSKGEEVVGSLEELVTKTLERLQVSSLFGYLYHSFDNYKKYRHTLEELKAVKKKGLIQHLGVSIYTNEQFEELLKEDNAIDIIQLPYNLLDNQGQRGTLLAQAKEMGKIIHTRSVFLQGLFFKPLEELPQKLLPLKADLQHIKSLADVHQIDMATLALSYATANELIDGLLVGVDNLHQLKANIEAITYQLPQNIKKDIDSILVQNKSLLNPSTWS